MARVALLEYIPRTASLAGQRRLCVGWLTVRLLARAQCLATPCAPWGDGPAELRL